MKPTNGRIVHYAPTAYEVEFDRTQPKAAIIVHVHGPELVNLSVFNQAGHSLAHPNVRLLPTGVPSSEERARGGIAWWPEREGPPIRETVSEARTEKPEPGNTDEGTPPDLR